MKFGYIEVDRTIDGVAIEHLNIPCVITDNKMMKMIDLLEPFTVGEGEGISINWPFRLDSD